MPQSTSINLPPNVSDTLQAFSGMYGVDSNVTQAVAQVASGGNQNTVSANGAVGVMQMLPSTFSSLAAPTGQVFLTSGKPYFTDINDPAQNMEAGTYYLSQQYQQYGNYPTAVAAYTAGPDLVSNTGGIPTDNTTQKFVRNVSMLAKNAGSTSTSLTTTNLQNTSNSAGQATSPAATDAQATTDEPAAIEPIVTSLQIPAGLNVKPWFDDTSLLTGNPRARKSVQPVAFKVYLSQKTGEMLTNPDTQKPIELRLNASLTTIEIQSRHIYNRTPSRTGQHVTFWGMQPDLIVGSGSTGMFLNQFGITDFFSVADINDDIKTLVTAGVQRNFIPSTGTQSTGTVSSVGINNPTEFSATVFSRTGLSDATNAFRVAAQDCFIEFLKLFQMNGNVYFYNPNYASSHVGDEQSTPTGWSAQTGLTALQQNARNNDVFSRGYIAMEYRNNVYLGYFKSLTWTQDAEKPFHWLFNFTFQVERTYTALYVPALVGFPTDTPLVNLPVGTTLGEQNA